MPDYSFNVQVAEEFGVDGAIFIHALAFWINKNQANNRHYYDGRTWTYNTQKALAELFPFWTKRQIGRIASNLKEQGAIFTGSYSKDKTDRTTWYALSDHLMGIYGISAPMSPNGNMQDTESSSGSDQTVTCNRIGTVNYSNIPPYSPPKGDGPKKGRRSSEPKETADWKPERFEGFWKFYPRHENRQKAIAAWDKLRPNDDLISRMGVALVAQKHSESWTQGIGIPHASTWLNNRRWEDEITVPTPPDDDPSDRGVFGWQ